MINQQAYLLGTNRSVIRDLFDYGNMRAAIVGRENVFDFSIGNPSEPVPEAVSRAFVEILQESNSLEVHGYTSAPGLLETRQAIADDLNNRYNAGVAADDLFISTGASAELVAVIKAMVTPGAEFLVIAPYFPEYKPFIEGNGGVMRIVPPDVPNFQISLEEVEKQLSPNTAAILLNSPCNPSGTVCTEETIRKLSALLERRSREYGHPIYIISDDPYRELVYDGAVAPFVPLYYPNTVVCYSYSKSLSLAGERIGYIYVPKTADRSRELYAAIAGASRTLGHICAPSLLQKVIARCAHLRPNLASYDRNRKFLYESLTAMGYEMARPDGAFYMFVKAPGGDAEAFSRKAMGKDVLLVPGDSFGCPGYLRICYCVSYDMIRRSLPAFKALIEE
jgi:aspartate aminotransferase